MRHILMLAGSDAKNTPRFLSEHLHDNFDTLMRLKFFCNFWAVGNHSLFPIQTLQEVCLAV